MHLLVDIITHVRIVFFSSRTSQLYVTNEQSQSQAKPPSRYIKGVLFGTAPSAPDKENNSRSDILPKHLGSVDSD